MISPGLERTRVLMSAEVDPSALVESLREIGRSPMWEIVKVSGRTSVFAGEVLGNQRVIVKTMALTRVSDAFARLARRTRLERQVRGAQLASYAGIITAEPRVLVRGRDAQGRTVDTLVVDRLPGRTLLTEIAEGVMKGSRARSIARAVGSHVWSVWAAGLFNRDCKPSNLVVLPEAFGDAIGLIDTVGVRDRRRGDTVEKMLANLAAELVGTGLVPGRTQLMRAIIEAGLEPGGGWRDVARALGRRGDHTPREDPLRGQARGS